MTANRVQPWLDDGDLQLYHGDALTVLQALPAGIAQTCVTSPPFFGLRDYGVDGQLGLERTLGEFLERLLAVFAEVWRVLRADGTAWVEIGDTYAAKGLMGVPWAFAFAMRDAGWLLRSDIVWSRPNPMPESVTDRPTKSHSYLFLFSKQPRYFYDSDAIRESFGDNTHGWKTWNGHLNPDRNDGGAPLNGRENPAGRNRRSVWVIPTQPFPEAHFATYPEELVRPCILAGTSERGECVECGAPWRRQTDGETYYEGDDGTRLRKTNMVGNGHGGSGRGPKNNLGQYIQQTIGWEPSCGCCKRGCIPDPCVCVARPQLVLDPFIGSGTTSLVARKHGRRSIGIDLSAEYLELAAKRTQQLSLLGGAA